MPPRKQPESKPRVCVTELGTQARRLYALARLLRDHGLRGEALVAENVAIQLRQAEFAERPILRIV